jgi:hypothetical protein
MFLRNFSGNIRNYTLWQPTLPGPKCSDSEGLRPDVLNVSSVRDATVFHSSVAFQYSVKLLPAVCYTVHHNQLIMSGTFLGAFAKSRRTTISVVISVRPSVRSHGTTRLPLDGCWWGFTFKIFPEMSYWYLARITGAILEGVLTFMTISRWILLIIRNVSDKSCSENQKIYLRWISFFFRKSYRFWENVEKYGGAREATDDNKIRRMRFACLVSKASCAQAYSHAHANARANTHTRKHDHTRARLHAHTHTCTQTQIYVIRFAFPLQQWFRERALKLLYAYIACLVIH